MQTNRILIALTTLLTLLGCSEQGGTASTLADVSISNADCGFKTVELEGTDKQRFDTLDAQLVKLLEEVEHAEGLDEGERRLVWTEAWMDLAWLRARAGDTEGAQLAGAQVLDKGNLYLSTLSALAHLPGSDSGALLDEAKAIFDPKFGKSPYELTDPRAHRVRDEEMMRMHDRCQIAGFYAYFDNQVAVEKWTSGFDPGFFWGKYFHDVAEHQVALGHLAAGRADAAQALADGWEASKRQKKQPLNLEFYDVKIARALRCAGQSEEALKKLDTIAARPGGGGVTLAMLANEYAIHGKTEQSEEALTRIIEAHQAVEIDKRGRHDYFRKSREEFVEPLVRFGLMEQANTIIDQTMQAYEAPDQPSHNAMWQADNIAHLFAAAGRNEEAAEYAAKASEIAELIRRPGELPSASRVVRVADEVRDSSGPGVLIKLEQYDTRVDKRLIDARDATLRSGLQFKDAADRGLSEATLPVRCGVLLGQMHSLVESSPVIGEPALARGIHHE